MNILTNPIHQALTTHTTYVHIPNSSVGKIAEFNSSDFGQGTGIIKSINNDEVVLLVNNTEILLFSDEISNIK